MNDSKWGQVGAQTGRIKGGNEKEEDKKEEIGGLEGLKEVWRYFGGDADRFERLFLCTMLP